MFEIIVFGLVSDDPASAGDVLISLQDFVVKRCQNGPLWCR